MARVGGDRDDVVEDDVIGQQIEEVPAVGEAVEPLLDDPEERLQRLEVVEVVDRGHHVPYRAQACAVRRAKSAKLIGGTPVTAGTSLSYPFAIYCLAFGALAGDPALMRLARIVHAADTASDLDSEPGRAGTARRHPPSKPPAPTPPSGRPPPPDPPPGAPPPRKTP